MAPFDLHGIDHIVLRVRNLERMRDFYVNVLGCSTERVTGSLTQLRAGRSLIDLVPRNADEPDGRNVDHLCLTITPFEPDILRDWLLAGGATVGEIADRYGAEGRGPSLYLEDPEGNGLELKMARS